MGADAQRPTVITYAGVGFSAEGLFEGSAGCPRIVVPRARIERIRLRCGFRARHALALGLFGVLLIGVGVAPIPHLVSWLLYGGQASKLEFLALVLIVLGTGAIYEALQRGYLLEVETSSGRQRLEFDKSAGSNEIEAFVCRVEQSFGYPVERNILQQ